MSVILYSDNPIERDWTKKTLVIDLLNSLGEKYHFEIEPNSNSRIKTVPSASPDDEGGALVYIQMPLL